MFFTVCPHADSRLPYHDSIGDMVLSHDAGWHSKDSDVWFKGYKHNNIEHSNFAEITNNNNHIQVHTGNARSFPLWWNEESQTLTNLAPTGVQMFADRVPNIGTQSNFEWRDVIGNIDTSEITVSQAVDLIVQNLCAKARALAQDYSHLPLRLFITGGIDTVTLFALMRNQNIDFELLNYNHFEFDHFLNAQYPLLKETHWAYQRIHHWTKPCMLLTGANGDESMMRGPGTLSTWAAWHNINVLELLKQQPGYHSNYFGKAANAELFEHQLQHAQDVREKYPTKHSLFKSIVDINLNDHQYWHLGHTLTWTPFADAEITKIMLRLSTSDMISQIIDATVSRQVIQRLYEPAVELISDRKNVGTRKKLHLLDVI